MKETISYYTEKLRQYNSVTLSPTDADTFMAYLTEFEPALKVTRLDLLTNTIIKREV